MKSAACNIMALRLPPRGYNYPESTRPQNTVHTMAVGNLHHHAWVLEPSGSWMVCLGLATSAVNEV